jgi:hypothetical protein
MLSSDKLREAIRQLKEMHDKMEVTVPTRDIAGLNPVASEMNTSLPTMNVVSLDGSYTTLWQSPLYPIYLVAVRVAIVKRRYDHSAIKIGVIADEFVDKVMPINPDEITRETTDAIEILDTTGDFEDKDIESIVQHEAVRAEEEVCKEVAENCHDVMILYDGSIAPSTKNRRRIEFIRGVLDACDRNNNILVGISKDSKLKKINNIIEDERLLAGYAAENPGFTGFKIIDEGATTRVGTCFARLHPSAMKWFRVDYQYTDRMDVREILRTIACYSQVNTMPGTPFPPLVAHEIAVKIRQLKSSIEERVMRMLRDEGFSGEFIIRGRTDVNGKLESGTHHDYLDNFTRVPTGAGRR